MLEGARAEHCQIPTGKQQRHPKKWIREERETSEQRAGTEAQRRGGNVGGDQIQVMIHGKAGRERLRAKIEII